MAITISPLLIFVITMWICISITKRAGNTVFDGRFTLDDNVLANDISAYGIDSPAHQVFAIGFTLLSLLLSGVMYLRYRLWNIYMKRAAWEEEKPDCCSCCCCSFNTIVLIVGLLHTIPLIVMGWTDGKQGQLVHFPAAMLGLGLLHIYCLLQLCLDIQVLLQSRRRRGREEAESDSFAATTGAETYPKLLSQSQVGCVVIEIVALGLTVIFVPMFVVRWLSSADSKNEWIAVALLLCSTMPAVLVFGAMSSDLYAAGKRSMTVNDPALQSELLADEETQQPSITVQSTAEISYY